MFFYKKLIINIFVIFYTFYFILKLFIYKIFKSFK